MLRPFRRFAALLAIAALAFAQLAVSAYACPKGIEAQAVQADASTTHDSDCSEGATANLCDSHCAYGAASVSTHHADSAPAPDLVLMPVRPAVPAVLPAGAEVGTKYLRAPATPPPPARPTPLRI